MGDAVLANVSCGGENVTNNTTGCAGARGDGGQVSAIDCVTWTLVIADQLVSHQ